MRAVDTNILARFILQDDARQARQAEAILREPVWIAGTVLLELGWVLSRRLGMDRAVVADALSTVLGLDTTHMAYRAMLLWAVERFRAGADWADVVHLVNSRDAADVFVTFDRDLARAAGAQAPIRVDTLA